MFNILQASYKWVLWSFHYIMYYRYKVVMIVRCVVFVGNLFLFVVDSCHEEEHVPTCARKLETTSECSNFIDIALVFFLLLLSMPVLHIHDNHSVNLRLSKTYECAERDNAIENEQMLWWLLITETDVTFSLFCDSNKSRIHTVKMKLNTHKWQQWKSLDGLKLWKTNCSYDCKNVFLFSSVSDTKATILNVYCAVAVEYNNVSQCVNNIPLKTLAEFYMLKSKFCQFSSSPRDAVSDAIVSSAGTRSSSSTASKATSSAKSKSVNECGLNDTPFMPASTVLSSNQSTPVAKESGANLGKLQSRSWTKHSWDWDARTQLTELLYRALIKLTILSGIQSLVSDNQSDDRLSESKAKVNRHRLHKSDDRSLAVIMQCCLRLLCDHMRSDQWWNCSAENVCMSITMA